MRHNFSPPSGGKSTLPVLALESGGRERYNAFHPRDEQEPCVMTEREKLLSGLEYNSRDEELIGMYRKVYKGGIMGGRGHMAKIILSVTILF
ncbi:hypothetical protein SL267_42910 [Serratia marcescens]|uniref:hypothetical protein n=2 Tax=Serratia TaxID=613 RepID=UPI001E2DBFDE|nr:MULTISPECIES: hypothetical protein [Serratia]BCZ59674.1 hypothetical protein SL267_42910 [Serratia marcescens]